MTILVATFLFRVLFSIDEMAPTQPHHRHSAFVNALLLLRILGAIAPILLLLPLAL